MGNPSRFYIPFEVYYSFLRVVSRKLIGVYSLLAYQTKWHLWLVLRLVTVVGILRLLPSGLNLDSNIPFNRNRMQLDNRMLHDNLLNPCWISIVIDHRDE